MIYDSLLKMKATNTGSNTYHASVLQNLYMGNRGEVISFLQYSYQVSQLKTFNNTIVKIFERICQEENEHMQLLASQITLLAADPIYAQNNKFLGGRAISYAKNIKTMLVSNIEMKETSIIEYKKAILKIDNQNIKTLLQKILADEQTHLALLYNIPQN